MNKINQYILLNIILTILYINIININAFIPSFRSLNRIKSTFSKQTKSNEIQSYKSKVIAYKSLQLISSDEGDEDNEEDTKEEVVEEPSNETAQQAWIDNSISPIKQGLNISTNINGSDVRVGIIMSRWNADIIDGLYKGVNESLYLSGVKQSNIFTTYVPGAFEIPLTAKFLAASKRFDVILCLGCLIKGETMHFEYIAQAAANGIMQVQLETYIPCIFGILTVLNKEQAIVRSTGVKNEGLSWGVTAVEMGLARMSALGIGKPQTKSDTSAFVTFGNSTVVPSKNETTSKPKKPFGF